MHQSKPHRKGSSLRAILAISPQKQLQFRKQETQRPAMRGASPVLTADGLCPRHRTQGTTCRKCLRRGRLHRCMLTTNYKTCCILFKINSLACIVSGSRVLPFCSMNMIAKSMISRHAASRSRLASSWSSASSG